MELLSNAFSGVIGAIVGAFIANYYKKNNKNEEKIADLKEKWDSAELLEYRDSVKECIKRIAEVQNKQPSNNDFALGMINQNIDKIRIIIEFLSKFKTNYSDDLRKKDFAKNVFIEANEILNGKISNTIKTYIYNNQKEYFDDLAKFYKNNQ